MSTRIVIPDSDAAAWMLQQLALPVLMFIAISAVSFWAVWASSPRRR